MLRGSRVLLGGGPGRSLCNPTAHGLSDGPYRRLKFVLNRQIARKRYRDVLVSADVDGLLCTASELLLNSAPYYSLLSSALGSSPKATPEATSKTIPRGTVKRFFVALAPLFGALDSAPSRSGTRRRMQQQQLLLQHRQHAAAAAAAATEASAAAGVTPAGSEVLRILEAATPKQQQQQQVEQQLQLLGRLVWRKIAASVPFFQPAELNRTVLALNGCGLRVPPLLKQIEDRALAVHSQFSAADALELLRGFAAAAFDCDALLQSFEPLLLQHASTLTRKEVHLLQHLIDEADHSNWFEALPTSDYYVDGGSIGRRYLGVCASLAISYKNIQNIKNNNPFEGNCITTAAARTATAAAAAPAAPATPEPRTLALLSLRAVYQ
ncbi:hypothetical protein, conserved [Eimeria maxima]|uniref:Uncharacterized protein n=1 Tax=Eimeria maxima TaxID=5804 RepID=U6M7B7_EIMMA|nr:hypothetical protein, conserved [Eimeria maxima]CDJ60092.1 hypothetical protein, conserved [Eimeria maxima]